MNPVCALLACSLSLGMAGCAPPRPAASPSRPGPAYVETGDALLRDLDALEQRLLVNRARVSFWTAKSCRGWRCA